jgi:hypothetical protein
MLRARRRRRRLRRRSATPCAAVSATASALPHQPTRPPTRWPGLCSCCAACYETSTSTSPLSSSSARLVGEPHGPQAFHAPAAQPPRAPADAHLNPTPRWPPVHPRSAASRPRGLAGLLPCRVPLKYNNAPPSPRLVAESPASSRLVASRRL